MKTVYATYVFDNGMVISFDKEGEQIPELQGKFTKELRAKIREHSCEHTEYFGYPVSWLNE